MIQYIDSKQRIAADAIAEDLKKRIGKLKWPWKETVFLCIGTDRLTGDCLGPYVGKELLEAAGHIPGISVYGTLENPVHALNLWQTSRDITRLHPDALVIAVDASLGQKEHLGFVTIGDGALLPGAGVQKTLPAVGNLHITGIVNTGGFLDHWMLQTTPLSTVVALADVISAGIRSAISEGFFSGRPGYP